MAREDESSHLITSKRSGPNRKKFLHQSIALFLFFGIETSLLAVAGAILWTGPVIVSIVWIVVALQSIFLLLSAHGFYLWRQGDLPLSKEEEDDARFVTTADGRRIEYFVWGSEKPNATVSVVCHGSNTTGKYLNQYLYPDNVMKELNIKVISPSYPGHGGSDAKPHRRIQKWPKEDLEPILKQESIANFIVQGSSYGTAHAMATAACFKERCGAMALNVPYLPKPICREFGFHTDADYVLNEALLARPYIMLPILSLLRLFQNSLSQAMSVISEGKEAIQRNMEIVSVLEKDTRRSFLRGVTGQVYEMLNADTNQHWVDPRTDIQTPIVAVWYAEDDSACPPAHGKWLAEIFQEKEEGNCNVRAEKKGLGHFTYMGEEDTQNGVQTKALLGMIRG